MFAYQRQRQSAHLHRKPLAPGGAAANLRIGLSRKRGILKGTAACEQGRALSARSRTGRCPLKRVFGYFLHEQKVTLPSPAGDLTGVICA